MTGNCSKCGHTICVCDEIRKLKVSNFDAEFFLVFLISILIAIFLVTAFIPVSTWDTFFYGAPIVNDGDFLKLNEGK